jgi:hypothetical protein
VRAAFEWCVEDFIAQVIDATDAFDDLVMERSELNATRRVSFWRGSLGEKRPAKITCQQLSELRKGHVVGDETTTAAAVRNERPHVTEVRGDDLPDAAALSAALAIGEA